MNEAGRAAVFRTNTTNTMCSVGSRKEVKNQLIYKFLVVIYRKLQNKYCQISEVNLKFNYRWCDGLNCVFAKIPMLKSQSPRPHNVTLFGDRVFTEIIKLK